MALWTHGKQRRGQPFLLTLGSLACRHIFNSQEEGRKNAGRTGRTVVCRMGRPSRQPSKPARCEPRPFSAAEVKAHISLRGFASQSWNCTETLQPGSCKQLICLLGALAGGPGNHGQPDLRSAAILRGPVSSPEKHLCLCHLSSCLPSVFSLLLGLILASRPFLLPMSSTAPAGVLPGEEEVSPSPLCPSLLRTGSGAPYPLVCFVSAPRNSCTI